MSKKLYDNYNLRCKIPLDKRSVSTDGNDIDRSYEGLLSYFKNDKKYHYYDNGWHGLLDEVETDIANLLTHKNYENYINAKEFGAKGDGTTDDTLSIQNAIDFAFSQGGGVVLLPKGVYIITTLDLKNNVSLYGTNPTLSTLKQKNNTNIPVLPMNNAVNMITIINSKVNVEIRNLTLDGNKSNQTIPIMFGIYSESTENLFVENVIIKNVVNTAMYSGHGKQLYIKNVIMKDSGNGFAFSEIVDVRVESSEFNNNTEFGILNYGIANSTDKLIIIGCKMMFNHKRGISISRVSQTDLTTNIVINAVIQDCIAKYNTWDGIMIQATNATISGNVSMGNGDDFTRQGFLLSCYHSTITNNVSIGNRGVGYDLGDGQRNVFVGNISSNNGGMGVEICSSNYIVCANNLVEDNNVHDEAQLAHGGAGITIYAGTPNYKADVSDIICTGNILSRTYAQYQDYGIQIGRNIDTTETKMRVIIANNNCYNSGNKADIRIFASDASIKEYGNIINSSQTQNNSTTMSIDDTGEVFYRNIGTVGDLSTITPASTIYRNERKITIIFVALGITVKHNIGNILLNGGTDFVPKPGASLQLIYYNGKWCEIGRTNF